MMPIGVGAGVKSSNTIVDPHAVPWMVTMGEGGMVTIRTIPSLCFCGAWCVMARAELSRAILSVLAENPQNPLKLTEIAALVGRPARDGSLRRALAGLVGDGCVERVGNDYREVPSADTRMAPGGTSGTSELQEGIPEPPVGLGEDGREVWALAWGANWSKAPDAAQIAHLCRLEDEAERLIRVIESQGMTLMRPIVAPRGDVVGEEVVMHPGIAELRKLDSQLMALRASLGLDPQSRARMGVEMYDRRPDALDEIVEQRRKRLGGAS
jgi:hypothetical protein